MRTYLTLITPASFYVQLDINYRGGEGVLTVQYPGPLGRSLKKP